MKTVVVVFVALVMYVAFEIWFSHRTLSENRMSELRTYCANTCLKYHATGYSVDAEYGRCSCVLQYQKTSDLGGKGK